MALKAKGNLLDPSTIAAMNAATQALGGKTPKTSGSAAYLNAPVNNSTLGLKDKTGKLLPDTITGQQFKDALLNTKYNATVIENLKQQSAPLLGLKTLSATGQILPTEVNAITQSVLAGGYYNTPIGKPIDILGTIKGIKDGSLAASANTTPWTIPSTISRTQFDQPNVEASKATINDVFLNLLGRSATEKEIQTYSQKYLNYAAKNPTDRTTGQNTYQTVSVPNTSGTTTSRLFRGSQTETGVTSNLNEQAYLQNQVKQGGEYNAFTAAGNAFDMMTKMAQKDTGTV